MPATPSRTRKAAPPPRKSRAVAKEASREALIAAAIRLFARDGLDVSQAEICAYAGYTRGAFYVHFESRDDLIAAAMERITQKSLDALLGLDSSDDIETVVRRFPRRLRKGEHPISKAGGVRPHQLLDACARSPAIHAQYNALTKIGVERTAEMLKANQKAGGLRRDVDAAHAAVLLKAAMIGFEVLHDMDSDLDLDGCADTLIKLMSRA